MQAHASKESMVEDHCIQYALSTSEPEFSTVCNHLHSLRCQDCTNIDSTLETIKTKAEDFPWQNKEDWAMKFLPRKYREGIDIYLNLQLKMLNITN